MIGGKTSLRSKKEKWEQYYRIWRLIETAADKTRLSEKSMLRMPATKQAIDSAYDHIMSIVFSIDPPFNIAGRQVEDDIKAELVKQYIAYLFQKEQFERKYGEGLKELLVYGTMIGRVSPKIVLEKKLEVEPRYEPQQEIDQFAAVQTRDVLVGHDPVVAESRVIRPFYQTISIWNFFPDPMASNCEDAEGLILRSWPSMQSLRKMERAGEIEGIKQLKEQKATEEDKDFLQRLAMIGIQPQEVDRSKNPMALEYWGWLEEDVLRKAGYPKEKIVDGGAEVTAIVCGDTTLKLIKNPFITNERPFVKACYEEAPGEFHGIGIVEASHGAQRALEATVRSRIDNKALAINTMWGINTRRLVHGQNMSVFPGKQWLTNGPIREAIEQFKVDDVTSGSYQEAAEFERYIQEGARVSRSLGGQPVKRGEMSATESGALTQAANTAILNVVKRLDRDILKPVLRWYYQIIEQFLDIPDDLILTNEQSGEKYNISVTPEAIAGDYDFIPMGTTNIMDQNRLSKLQHFMQMVIQSQVLIQMVDLKYLLKTQYKLLMGPKEMDKVLSGVNQGQAVVNSQAMQNQGSMAKPPQQGGAPNAVAGQHQIIQ